MAKVGFSSGEIDFLERNDACRVATCRNNIPHVVPVAYIFDRDVFIFATDYGTIKLRNISANKHLALTVDVYSSHGNKAVCIQGEAKIIKDGSEFRRLYGIFHRRFAWVRREPWEEGEAPFVKVKPTRKVSWGLD